VSSKLTETRSIQYIHLQHFAISAKASISCNRKSREYLHLTPAKASKSALRRWCLSKSGALSASSPAARIEFRLSPSSLSPLPQTPLAMSDSASDKKDLEQPVEAKLYSASILSSKENARFGSTSISHRKLESYHVNLIAIGGEQTSPRLYCRGCIDLFSIRRNYW
jgi:hypothetical protein